MTARRPRRFVVAARGESGALVSLSPSDARHATRVLRLVAGEPVAIVTGDGPWQGRIAAVGRDRVDVVLEHAEPVVLAAGRIVLLVGLAHVAALDDAVRAATELGVACLVPLVTERGEHRSSEAIERRRARWQRIAREAVKQCGRADSIAIEAPLSVAEAAGLEADARWLLEPAGGQPLELERWRGSLLIAVGPEGGFTPAEAGTFRGGGFVPVRIGPHVARVATAVAAAATLAHALHDSGAGTE